MYRGGHYTLFKKEKRPVCPIKVNFALPNSFAGKLLFSGHSVPMKDDICVDGRMSQPP